MPPTGNKNINMENLALLIHDRAIHGNATWQLRLTTRQVLKLVIKKRHGSNIFVSADFMKIINVNRNTLI